MGGSDKVGAKKLPTIRRIVRYSALDFSIEKKAKKISNIRMLMPCWIRQHDALHYLLLLLIFCMMSTTTTTLSISLPIMVDGLAVVAVVGADRCVSVRSRGNLLRVSRRRYQCCCCHGYCYRQNCRSARMMVPILGMTSKANCRHPHHHHHHHKYDYSNRNQPVPKQIVPKQPSDSRYFDNAAAAAAGGRRSFLSRIAATLPCHHLFLLTSGFPLVLTTAPSPSNALPILLFTTANPSSSERQRRRQLELCLVAVLRTEYWAMSVAQSLNTQLLLLPPPPPSITIPTNTKTEHDDPQQQQQQQQSPPPELLTEYQKKSSYLEARLGAKALLTQKIGGGANAHVRTLGSFQLKECLDDAKYWCREYYYAQKKNPLLLSTTTTTTTTNSKNSAKQICSIDLSNAIDDLIDSLASIVEFDGLETTIDPSPRSSLMLSMYNHQKGTFVYRTLMERVVPSCERILNVFGRERRSIVEEFVRTNYAMEMTPTTRPAFPL